MRIIAGKWGGRKLIAPSGDTTRPTADRVREALFSMLASRLGGFEGLRVADLFAGSGALGLEALSRGAAQCTFVENDANALRALWANVAAVDANAEIIARSAIAIPPVSVPSDLVLLDPPYGSDAGPAALDALTRQGWLTPATLLSYETARDGVTFPAAFAAESQRVYGKAKITLLRWTG